MSQSADSTPCCFGALPELAGLHGDARPVDPEENRTMVKRDTPPYRKRHAMGRHTGGQGDNVDTVMTAFGV